MPIWLKSILAVMGVWLFFAIIIFLAAFYPWKAIILLSLGVAGAGSYAMYLAFYDDFKKQ